MLENIVIEPMIKDFILWRCLHGGPLSQNTIDQWSADTKMPWERYRTRNTALLAKLTDLYGACAMVARDGENIVGILRFYPKSVGEMEGAGLLCLQQDSPAGPRDNFSKCEFPPREELENQTLEVHCLMTGSPQQKENPYQRKGIGTRLARAMITWAKENGWERIEATSFEDLPIVYGITGDTGHTFWEKLGFHIADRFLHTHLIEGSEFAKTIEEQAISCGIDPARAKDCIIMRLDLM